jgi:hypothetical protein
LGGDLAGGAFVDAGQVWYSLEASLIRKFVKKYNQPRTGAGVFLGSLLLQAMQR